MRNCFFKVIDFKGYSMKLSGVPTRPGELSRVDHHGFSEPIHVSAGNSRGLVDVAVKGQKWLVPFDKSSDGTASSRFSSLDEIQSSSEGRGMHEIDRSFPIERF